MAPDRQEACKRLRGPSKSVFHQATAPKRSVRECCRTQTGQTAAYSIGRTRFLRLAKSGKGAARDRSARGPSVPGRKKTRNPHPGLCTTESIVAPDEAFFVSRRLGKTKPDSRRCRCNFTPVPDRVGRVDSTRLTHETGVYTPFERVSNRPYRVGPSCIDALKTGERDTPAIRPRGKAFRVADPPICRCSRSPRTAWASFMSSDERRFAAVAPRRP